jgi:hypothetical protein
MRAEEKFMSPADLPSRFPVGTRYVVEGEDGRDGALRIVARYLIYPDGKRVDLLVGKSRRARRTARARAPQGRQR